MLAAPFPKVSAISSECCCEPASLAVLFSRSPELQHPMDCPGCFGQQSAVLKLRLHRLTDPKQNWDTKRQKKASQMLPKFTGCPQGLLRWFIQPLLTQGGAAGPPAGAAVPSPKSPFYTVTQLLLLLEVQNASHGDSAKVRLLVFLPPFPCWCGRKAQMLPPCDGWHLQPPSAALTWETGLLEPQLWGVSWEICAFSTLLN